MRHVRGSQQSFNVWGLSNLIPRQTESATCPQRLCLAGKRQDGALLQTDRYSASGLNVSAATPSGYPIGNQIFSGQCRCVVSVFQTLFGCAYQRAGTLISELIFRTKCSSNGCAGSAICPWLKPSSSNSSVFG